jgi:hypothetical protein
MTMKTYDPGKSTTEVRQGNSRLMNMRVLLFSTVGVLVALGLVFLWFFVFAPGPGTAN